MRVMLAGGNGFIGRALSSALLAGGHTVTVLTRAPKSNAQPGVVQRAWDARTPQGWGAQVEETDVIINLAGESIGAGRWSAARKVRILNSRVQAGQALTAAIRAAKNRPAVLVQASGIGHYGFSGNNVVREGSPAGEDFLAQVTVQWENATREVEDLGVRRIITRNGLVLSARSGIFPLVLLPFRLFVGGPVGAGSQWFPWIHIEDQVQGILHLIQRETASGVFNFVAPQALTNAEVGRTIARVLHRTYWFPAPAFAMRLALGEMSSLILEGQRAVPQRLAEAGYTFRYPTLEAALRAMFAST